MNTEQEIIDSLIIGGVVGASLGALISNDKERGVAIGALAGAALLATFNAYETARKGNYPLVYEENGVIYEESGGVKSIIREIEKRTVVLKNRYKLK